MSSYPRANDELQFILVTVFIAAVAVENCNRTEHLFFLSSSVAHRPWVGTGDSMDLPGGVGEGCLEQSEQVSRLTVSIFIMIFFLITVPLYLLTKIFYFYFKTRAVIMSPGFN